MCCRLLVKKSAKLYSYVLFFFFMIEHIRFRLERSSEKIKPYKYFCKTKKIFDNRFLDNFLHAWSCIFKMCERFCSHIPSIRYYFNYRSILSNIVRQFYPLPIPEFAHIRFLSTFLCFYRFISLGVPTWLLPI